MPSRSYERNPNHQRGGFSVGGNNQPFDSSPPNYPGSGGGASGFRPMGGPTGGGRGFRPMGGATGVGGGFLSMGGGEAGEGFVGGDGGAGYPMPHAGQKRGHPFSGPGTSPPDGTDSGSFAKLFVGSVPRTATEEEIRPLFEEHGEVIEVALLKDKRTGQQQGPLWG